MKRKNFKSAIHNFADSFQSIDYTKSGALAINVLIRLKSNGLSPTAEFDFLNRKVSPEVAKNKESDKLLEDYINRLPEHLHNHNCDIGLLEKLKIEITLDFDKSFVPNGMSNCLQIMIKTKIRWKLKEEPEEELIKEQNEVMKSQLLTTGLPSMF